MYVCEYVMYQLYQRVLCINLFFSKILIYKIFSRHATCLRETCQSSLDLLPALWQI